MVTCRLTQSPTEDLFQGVQCILMHSRESIASDDVYMPYSLADEVTGAL